MTRLGLVGCGRWGRNVLRDLCHLGCEVHVADPVPVPGPLPEGVKVASQVPDAEDLPPVEGYVVVTPSVSHGWVVARLLGTGLPIFVEKPMTMARASAAALAERGQGRLFVMQKWRYHPAVQEMGRLARSGSLGRPLGLVTRRLDWGNPHRDADAVWILGPHELSIQGEVLGGIPEPVAARADRVDGYCWGLTMTGGGSGDSPWAQAEVSFRHPGTVRSVTLHLEGGVVRLTDPLADHLEVYRGLPGAVRGDLPPPERIPVSTEMPLRRELACFVAHLRGGPPPPSDAAAGRREVEALARYLQLAGLPPDGPEAEDPAGLNRPKAG